jgi:hypothetical protein
MSSESLRTANWETLRGEQVASDPQVSVIIDTHNYARFIEQALESVFVQTLNEKHWEIIVVDDGSTDDTSSRLLRYYERICYIQKPNGGQASAFNAGVAASRGQIISFLDADDYFYPSKLARVLEALTAKPEVGVIYNRYDIVDEARRLHRTGVPLRIAEGYIAERTLLGYTSGCPSSGISVRRNLATRAQIPEGPFRISADHFYLNILPLMTHVGFLPDILHAYRVHGRNWYIGRASDEQRSIHLQQRETLWDYASTNLGRQFFRAEQWLSSQDSQYSIGERLKIYGSGIHYLVASDASALLRLWTFVKLTARLVTPGKIFSCLRNIRDRLRAKGSLLR